MEWIAGYVAIGAAVGFFAGMLGMGGGAIAIPLLALLFERQGLPREHLLHLAVASSMAAILFTSISSVRAHATRGAVNWHIARRITPGILLGGLAGAGIAGFFTTRAFAIFFTAFIYLAATSILLDLRPKPARELPGAKGMFAAGFGISSVSALAGIGGAVFVVPYLLWCNVTMIQAIGTASLIGFPIAAAATTGYIVTGLMTQGLPQWSLGFLYLPATAGMVIASMLTAPLGARAAHAMPTTLLKRVFAVLMYAIATRMLIKLWG